MDMVVDMFPEWTLGWKGIIPYRNKESLRRLVKLTEGKVIIVGGNTYRTYKDDFIKELKPSKWIVYSLSGTGMEPSEDLVICPNVDSILHVLDESDAETYIIGGQKTFIDLLPHTESVIITWNYVKDKNGIQNPIQFANLDVMENFNLLYTGTIWETSVSRNVLEKPVVEPYQFMKYVRKGVDTSAWE